MPWAVWTPPSISCLVCCQCLNSNFAVSGKVNCLAPTHPRKPHRVYVRVLKKCKKNKTVVLYFECSFKLNKWCSNHLAGLYLKTQTVSSVTVCFWLQGGGNVHGMTVPSAVPRPLPSVISAHAPFARIMRKGHSPHPHLKAVSAAPVMTLLVPWAPTPALPSHTAPPRAQS